MGPGLAYLAAWTYWVVHILPGAKAAGDTHCIGMGFKGDGSLIKEYTVVALQG